MEEYLTRVNQLDSYDDDIRERAIRAIRRSPAEPTKAALRAILEGDVSGNWSDRVRVTIAAILATWEDEETGAIDSTGLPELIEALRGPEASLRRMAVDTLPLFKAEAVRYVADVLKSGQRANREAASIVLGKMLQEHQLAAAGRALLEADLKDEESAEVRMAVVINLAEWDSDEAIGGFIEALTDPDLQVRSFAWDRIQDRADPPLEFDPRADFAPRAEAVQKIRAWWRDQSRR
jgi:HEAT repeat protein